MSNLLATDLLLDAFQKFQEVAEATNRPAPFKPSALLLILDPEARPNSAARIVGNPEHLVRLLRAVLHDPANTDFAREFYTHYLALT